MSQKIKNNIELRYQFIENSDSQDRLEEIFDFIFEETVEQIRFDKSKALRFTYNRLQNKGVGNEAR